VSKRIAAVGIWLSKKRAFVITATLSAMVIVLGLFLWQLWRMHRHAVAWGDVPTWLAFSAAGTAAFVALRQLRGQQRDIERQTRALERQQADTVGFSSEAAGLMTLVSSITDIPTETGTPLYMIVVGNSSSRPIRNVICRIKPESNQSYDLATQRVAGPKKITDYSLIWTDVREADRVPLIPAMSKFVFEFPITFEGYPNALVKVRFTDDAGLDWEIDDNLHLTKLDPRDDRVW
jgi:hypothetical protein